MDLLEVDLELLHVLLGVCNFFGGIESNDVVADLAGRFIGKAGVTDTELVVELGPLERYELGWCEAFERDSGLDGRALGQLAGEGGRRVTLSI